MNIIFFGCDISLSIFEALLELNHRIVALRTFHNPYDLVHEENITALAREKGIDICYGKMTEDDAQDLFETKACDVFVSAEYNRKVPIPESRRFKGINVHNSLLPEGKGFFAVETRRYLRLPYGGVTIHKLTAEFDEGDIILQEKFPLDESFDVPRIYQKCSEVSVEMCRKIFASDEAFMAYWDAAKPQEGVSSVWHPSKEERAIHADMTMEQARHLFSCYDRFTFARTAESEGGDLRRVMGIRSGGENSGDEVRPGSGADGQFQPFVLKDGVLWVNLE